MADIPMGLNIVPFDFHHENTEFKHEAVVLVAEVIDVLDFVVVETFEPCVLVVHLVAFFLPGELDAFAFVKRFVEFLVFFVLVIALTLEVFNARVELI
jgi:hypothetical protein